MNEIKGLLRFCQNSEHYFIPKEMSPINSLPLLKFCLVELFPRYIIWLHNLWQETARQGIFNTLTNDNVQGAGKLIFPQKTHPVSKKTSYIDPDKGQI